MEQPRRIAWRIARPLLGIVCLLVASPRLSAKDMHFRVVDADTAMPVAGVTVHAWVRTNLVTDTNGNCNFPLPAPKPSEAGGSGDFYYRINIAKDGYVPKFISWSRAQGDHLETIPEEYTAKLNQAASVGGFVKNDAGEPIAGARVILSGVNPDGPAQRERTTVAQNYHVERTDEKGHWHCDHLPRNFENMTFKATHPDYLPTTFGCTGFMTGGNGAVPLPKEDFLDGTAAMVLGHGIELAGILLDASNQPVSGATITRNHEWRNSAAVLESDADGRFKILNLRSGLMFLTIQAKGLEPLTMLLTNHEDTPELKLTMEPGKILKGKIVDTAGQPIAGATVQMDRLDFHPLEYDWTTATDADGRFLWDSAPADAHPYYISASGYNSRSEPSLIADGQDKVIVLRKSQDGKAVIDGTVVDAQTRMPIEKFTLITREFKQDGNEGHSQSAVAAKTGEYTAAIGQDSTSYLIEIRADGYLPFVSERKNTGDGDRRINFELEKGEVFAGTVYLPDGTPAAGAQVAICSPAADAVLGAGRLIEQFRTNLTVSGPDGTFAFPAMDGAQAVYAAHPGGFGQLDLEGVKPPFRVALRPWGKVEGTARAGGKPVTDAKMSLAQPFSYMNLSLALYDFLSKTDANGHFLFTNVPPIELKVMRMVNNTAQNPQFVTVEPGRTAAIDYGGTGRLVRGKFVVPGYDSPI